MQTDSELKLRFLALDRPQKLEFLAWLIHGLTIRARGYTWITDDSDSIRLERLTGLNEAIHVISSKIGGLLIETDKQYPDDVFFDILLERGDEGASGDTRIAIADQLDRHERIRANATHS